MRLTSNGYSCLLDGAIRGLVDFSYFDVQEMACVVEPLHLSCNLLAFLVQNARAYAPKTK